jgi:uncharacterized protein YecT (DUF1311 family)
MRLKPTLASCILLIASSPGWAQGNAPADISQAEIKGVINEYSDCDSLDQIDIRHLEYFDLFGDGRKEAIVVAYTCLSGTAGADVHAVYERGTDGKIVEHSLDQLEPISGFTSSGLPVFGNRNYAIAVEEGRLVARWGDSSDRKDPLNIWYKWDGKEFVVDHMKVEGPFTTSYDCAKATKELDRAICYSPSVAALDVQLSQLYRAALRQNADRARLQQQQREWVAQREKQCVIYKWWVDCLSDMYTKRIAELKQVVGPQ